MNVLTLWRLLSAKQRAASTPHQRPAAQDEEAAGPAQVQILKRGGEASAEGGERGAVGGKAKGAGAGAGADLSQLSRGNLTMSKDFKFDWLPIVESLQMS